MRQAQDGDQAAYSTVLRAIMPTIRAMAKRRGIDETMVEDVVQETLMTIHRVRHTYDPARPMMPWIAAIVSSRSIDVLRRSGRLRHREIMNDQAMETAADPAAYEPIAAIETGNILGQMLNLLTERQRGLVEKVKLQEKSLEEAALENRMSVPAVKMALQRAYARMRQYGIR